MGVNNEVLKSSVRLRKKKARRVFSYSALVLAILFAVTNIITHLDKLYIKHIYISGNVKVEDGQIFGVVANSLRGYYYGIYPKSNILIYPKKVVGDSIMRNIPWIASVAVSGGVNSVIVNVIEREPKYLWCDSIDKPIIDRICYYLDKDGFAFGRAPGFSGHIYPEFYGGDKKGGYIRKFVLPVEKLNTVLKIKDGGEKALADNNINLGKIYGFYIHNNGDYDLLLSDGKNEYKINFSLNTDVLKKLNTVLSSPFFIKELRDGNKRLEYIDLRFGKKVFYKFDNLLD